MAEELTDAEVDPGPGRQPAYVVAGVVGLNQMLRRSTGSRHRAATA